MKGSFKKVISSIFIILFILTSLPIASFGKNNSLPEGLPLTELSINPNLYAEKIISIPLYFNKRNLSIKAKTDGIEITLDNCKNMNIPDYPALPYFEKEVKIPAEKSLVYIKVKGIDTQAIPLPKNAPLKLADRPEPIFQTDKDPREWIPTYTGIARRGVDPLFQWDDRKARWDDKEKMWNDGMIQNPFGVFPKENFDCVITPCDGEKKLSLFINPVYYIRGELFLTNYIQIEIGLGEKPEDNVKTLANDEENKNLSVILTPDEFYEEAKLLKSNQESSGYKVEIVKISQISRYREATIPDIKDVKGYKDAGKEDKEILKNYDYSLARKIISFLQELLKEKKINYLTILGDGSKVPPSYYVLSPDEFNDYDKWVPTDIFYFAPNLKGKEYPLSISVGRLPVRDKDEAKEMVRKINRYKKALSDEWFKNVVTMGGDPFGGDYMGELMLTDCINKDYFEGMNVKKYFRTSGKFGKDSVFNCFESEKVGFIYEDGHGGGDTLYLEPGTIDSKEALSFKEKDELPIFLSVACGNGAYDTLVLDTQFSTNKYLKYPTSFSEALVLSKGGSIAYVGGARINYSGWSMEYKNGVPKLYSKHYMDAIIDYFSMHYHNEGGSLGDIARLALTTYADQDLDYINYADIKTFFGFTLLGDPTIKLPFFKGDFKSKVPEISLDKQYRLNPWDIPLFPIDDGVQINASTNSPELKYIFADYLNTDSPLLEEGKFEKSTKETFSYNFNKLIKSTLVVRVEAKDFKESRIVFFGRYWHDLVLIEDYDLTRLRVNENKDYVTILRNDGIQDESDITITIKNNGQEIKRFYFDKIPFFQTRYLQYNCAFSEEGEKNLEIIAPKLNGEKIVTDNTISKKLTVSEGDIIRVGVLAQSYFVNWNYINSALNIVELNRKLRNDGLPIEIFPVIFGRDAQTNTTLLKRLKVDMLILYTNNFFDYPINTYLSEIEEFSKDGGIVLGILSLGENSFGFSLKEIYPFFGLGKDKEFELFELENPEETLEVSDRELFEKKELNITTRYTFTPKDSNGWEDIVLENGKLIGISKSKKIGLIKYGNRLLYSGFISWKDLTKEDDTYYFFKNLLKSALKSRTDISISKVYLSPAIGRKNNSGILNISIRNCGNTEVREVSILVNPLNQFLKVQSLKGKEEREIKCEFNLRGITGRKDFEIIIDPENKIDEFNENNNKLKVCYNVSGEGEPDLEPELTLNIPEYLEVTEKELLIEGKTNPGATLYLQGEEVAKNSDGSFKKLITLSKGENTLSFTSKEGSLQTAKEIKIVLKKKIEILLKIGDKASFLNSELKTLPEAPLILNGITFVPLRFISEAFGANVSWVKEENKIIILFNDITLIMWIGKDRAELNGKELKLSAKPFISKSGITFVPLRIISEVFGAEVSWNAENSTITIKLKVDYEKDSQLESFNLLKSEEEVSSSVLIDATKPPEDVIFPSCFDIWKDEIYVSTYKGIYVLDKELNIKRKIDYPSQLEESIEPSYFRALTSTYSRNFLRVNEKSVIFSDGRKIFIFDKNSGEMETIIDGYFYGTLLTPLRKFRSVMDLEIYEDKLFVLDSFYGVDVIDMTKGELLARFDIYDFLVDIALANGKIYVISFLGRIYKLSLNGEDMESFKTKDTIFPFSLLATDDDLIYLNLSYPEYTLLKINPRNNWEIVKEYKLSSSIGQYLDRILPLDDNIYALAFNSRNSSSYLFEEKLVKLDKNFKLLGKVGSDGYNKVKTNDKFLISPEYVWYTNDGDYLLSQYYPLNPDYFKLYSKTGELKKAFSITPKDYNWIKISSTVQGNVIGTLFINYMTYKYYFEISEFTSKGTLKSKSIELKPKTKYYDYTELAFNDELVITFDYYMGEIVEFDINSGEEIKRFSLSEAQNEASLYFPHSIKLIDNKIYIFDFVKKVIRLYSLDGEIFSELDYKCYSELDKIKFFTDVRLMDNNKFALIDSENANLLIFDSESLSEVIGKKKRLTFEEEDEISTDLESLYLPYSFDIKEDSLLINDLGNYRVIERPHFYSKSEKLSCKIKLSPEYLDLIAYSKDSLESKVLVEIFNSDAPLEILESPPWITIDKFDQSSRNSLITFKIDPSKIEVNNFTRGIIIFKVSDQTAILRINLVRNTNEITFYSKSSLIKGDTKNYVSKAKAELRKDIILVSDDAVKNVFGFDVKRVGKEVIIFTESFTVKLKVGERKGSLLLPSSEVIIDLGEPLEERGGILLIPMNAILNFLSINYKVEGELIKIFLT